jgi:hypothetical protein
LGDALGDAAGDALNNYKQMQLKTVERDRVSLILLSTNYAPLRYTCS